MASNPLDASVKAATPYRVVDKNGNTFCTEGNGNQGYQIIYLGDKSDANASDLYFDSDPFAADSAVYVLSRNGEKRYLGFADSKDMAGKTLYASSEYWSKNGWPQAMFRALGDVAAFQLQCMWGGRAITIGADIPGAVGSKLTLSIPALIPIPSPTPAPVPTPTPAPTPGPIVQIEAHTPYLLTDQFGRQLCGEAFGEQEGEKMSTKIAMGLTDYMVGDISVIYLQFEGNPFAGKTKAYILRGNTNLYLCSGTHSLYALSYHYLSTGYTQLWLTASGTEKNFQLSFFSDNGTQLFFYPTSGNSFSAFPFYTQQTSTPEIYSLRKADILPVFDVNASYTMHDNYGRVLCRNDGSGSNGSANWYQMYFAAPGNMNQVMLKFDKNPFIDNAEAYFTVNGFNLYLCDNYSPLCACTDYWFGSYPKMKIRAEGNMNQFQWRFFKQNGEATSFYFPDNGVNTATVNRQSSQAPATLQFLLKKA